jgi:hypothetical protein
MKFNSHFLKCPTRGGAAVEYIIVSLFAAVVAIASVGFVGSLVQKKIQDLSQKIGLESTEFELDLDGF